MRRLMAKWGSRATSRTPNSGVEDTAESPARGEDRTPCLSRIRIAPGNFSVMRIFPSGRNARDHGACRVLASVVIVKGPVAWKGARVCSGNRGLSSSFSGGGPGVGGALRLGLEG